MNGGLTLLGRKIRWTSIGAVVCWALVGVWAAFTVMRVFGWERSWILITLVAFTPYVTMLSVVPVLGALALRRWRAAAVAVLSAVILASMFVPRVIGGPDPGLGPTLHVMTSNLKEGDADPATIVVLVRDQHIDLLALEEFTPEEKERLDAAGLDQLLPVTAITPLPGAYGVGIYSRYPLADTGVVTLTGGLLQQYATVLVPHALPLRFQASHTRAPDMPTYIGDWTHSIGEEPAATPDGPVRLLAGDFNSTLDHARLRALLNTGYVDVASQLGAGLTTTWPYDGRHLPPITLDHVFADPRIGAVAFGASSVPGSDHKAIFATVTLPAA